MDSIHGQVHGVLSELVEFQTVDLHHQIEGGALGLLGEAHPHLGVHVGHGHLAVLVGEGDPELVVALLDPVEAHAGDHRAVGDGVGDFGRGHGVEGAQNADLATVVHGGVTEGKDFQFQRGHHALGSDAGKGWADAGGKSLSTAVGRKRPPRTRQRTARPPEGEGFALGNTPGARPRLAP